MAFQFAQILFCPFADGAAERQTECDSLSLHSSNRSFHRLRDSRRRRLLLRIALQFAQVLFCPFTAGTAERQTEYEGLLPQSSDRSFRQLGNSLRRRPFTRMVLQFAQILFEAGDFALPVRSELWQSNRARKIELKNSRCAS